MYQMSEDLLPSHPHLEPPLHKVEDAEMMGFFKIQAAKIQEFNFYSKNCEEYRL